MRGGMLCLAMAAALLAAGAAGWVARGAQPVGRAVKLENAKVRVSEVVYQPGAPRERHVRATDQLIVFLEDCEYERTDPDSGAKTIRKRLAGEVIWHDKGEIAPVLVNRGEKAYRTLLIEFK